MSGARYEGKVALVTGGNGGIGLAVATLLVAEGARVVIAGRNRVKLDHAASTLGSDRCVALEADVSKADDNEKIVAVARERFGGLDVFIANAGIGLPTWRIVDTPVESFDQVIAVNLRGVFLGMKAALPAMRERGGGSFLVVSSIAGLKGRGTGNGAYVASKHAELGLVKTAAIENAEYGIRVNAVLPGPTDTTMIRELEAARARDVNGDGKAAILRGMPLGRYGHADEVARLIAFLASDDAGFCTGGIYTADGGLSAV
jgi:NAD(P)-dependent dehydrogenase (short-subunit alcohol dehydrogenase family)